MTSLEVYDPAAERAACRSAVYALLAACLRAPDPSLRTAIATGTLLGSLREAFEGAQWPPFPFERLDVGPDISLEQAYLEHFELGGPAGPPAVLYEAEHGGGRLKVLEDVLRFYDHFGLDPARGPAWRDRPDHVATELEFLHVLGFREAKALEEGNDPTPFRAAARDFLRFHALDVVTAISERIEPRDVPFYSALTALARWVCAHDLEALS
ncbi:MAG: molecular chaperone TorD family protein [Acidimicrobiia bacterium]|nr:molecular chaperone TorD family protein [Acidimicrobiia bacterium]